MIAETMQAPDTTQSDPQRFWINRAIDLLAGSAIRSLVVLAYAEQSLPAGEQAKRLAGYVAPTLQNIITKQCSRVFVSKGFMQVCEARDQHNRSLRAYKLNDIGHRYAVPVATAMLDCELWFPHTIASRIGSPLPEHRSRLSTFLRISDFLLNKPEGAFLKDIADAIAEDKDRLYGLLRSHETYGTIIRTPKPNFATRQLIVSQPPDPDSQWGPERKAVLRTAHKLHKTLYRRECTAQEFLELVLEEHQDLRPHEVARIMTHASYLTFTERRGSDAAPPRLSSYKIAPDLVPAISQLVKHYHALHSNPRFRQAARQRAQAFVASAEIVTYLLDKSQILEAADPMARLRASRAQHIAAHLGPILSPARAAHAAKDLAWEEAVCATIDPEIFFPLSYTQASLPQIDQAKRHCSGCSMRLPCLAIALANSEEYGIWGGETPSERHALPDNIRRQLVRYAANNRL